MNYEDPVRTKRRLSLVWKLIYFEKELNNTPQGYSQIFASFLSALYYNYTCRKLHYTSPGLL